MYCKNCGKEIADDSKFCQHCGTALQQVQVSELTPVVKQPKKKIKIEIPSIETNLSDKAKIGIGVYAGWVLLNFLCIFLDHSEYASSRFYPFYAWGKDTVAFIQYYDFTEFLVYTILAPLAIFGLYQLWKYIKKYFG